MGWRVERSQDDELSPATYAERVRKRYPREASVPLSFALNVEREDLIWYRDLNGTYYLAKVEGDWLYQDDRPAVDNDMFCVRRVKVAKVSSVESVPGKVLNRFVPKRTFQRISDAGCLLYSQSLFYKLQTGIEGLLPKLDGSVDFFSFISASDLEDLVMVYLQYKGWMLIPGSRRKDTVATEIVLINRETAERAFLQVKSGSVPLDALTKGGPTRWFLFAASQIYGDVIPSNVDAISRTELEDFIANYSAYVPDAVRRWRLLVQSNREMI